MPEPIYPDPVAPSLPSPLYDAPSGTICGDTFLDDIQIRYPVDGFDQYRKDLPRIWQLVLDIGRPYDSLEQRIGAAIQETTADLDASAGRMSGENFQAIDTLLEQAAEYADYAIELADYWSDEVLEVVDSSGVAPEDMGWMRLYLSAETPPPLLACENAEPGQVVQFSVPTGGTIEFRCPGLGTRGSHAQAFDRYKDTLQKAAMKARCAQEALYSLLAYEENRLAAAAGPMGPQVPTRPGDVIRGPLPRRAPRPPPPPPGGPVAPTVPIYERWSPTQQILTVATVLLAAGGLWYMMGRAFNGK